MALNTIPDINAARYAFWGDSAAELATLQAAITAGVNGTDVVGAAGRYHNGAAAVIPFMSLGDADVTWTNMPNALTELLGATRHRTVYDLTGFRQARMVARVGSVAGAAQSTLRLEYSLDSGATWQSIENASGGGSTAGSDVAIATTSTTAAGSWVTIHANARADVRLRVVGQAGDGVIDPVFGNVSAQVR